ncbi:hypothetical protein, partial [Levilactobacillus yonginensis]|uniref:hypothetical protein n=1 Tax=Levilactobacillus yonginensis TaxID=1054041 RepID=UPI001CDC5905
TAVKPLNQIYKNYSISSVNLTGTSTKMYNDTFYRYGYDGVRDNRVIFVRFFLDDATHGSRIDVKMNGQLHQAY